MDKRGDKIGAKIRDGELMKVPYLLIVGAKEAAEKKGSVRRRVLGDLGTMGLDEIAGRLLKEVAEKTLPPQPKAE